MPTYGTSFTEHQALDGVRIRLMLRDTTGESLDALQALVKSFTPVDTGELRNSINRTKVKRISSNVWYGEVYSNLYYASAVEYGVGPTTILPKTKKWLHWTTEAGESVFAKKVEWPGFQGRHMFKLGEEAFEAGFGESILKKNAAEWLGMRFDSRIGVGGGFRDISSGKFTSGPVL